MSSFFAFFCFFFFLFMNMNSKTGMVATARISETIRLMRIVHGSHSTKSAVIPTIVKSIGKKMKAMHRVASIIGIK